MANSNNTISSGAIGLVKTKQEAGDLINDLENLENSLFNLKSDMEKKIDECLTLEQKRKILFLCKEEKVNLKDPGQLRKFVTELKQKIERLPVISINIAFEPKEGTIDKIYNWFLLNLKKEIILDLKVDYDLIAGITLSLNGFYKDYSFKGIMDEKIRVGHLKFI